MIKIKRLIPRIGSVANGFSKEMFRFTCPNNQWIINLSVATSKMPNMYKSVVVKPLLKRRGHTLHITFSAYQGTIDFKIPLTGYKGIHGIAPYHISVLFQLRPVRLCSLRSHDCLWLVAQTCKNKLGEQAFSYTGPKLLNPIPLEIGKF